MNQFETEMLQKFGSVSDEIDNYLKKADENEKKLIEIEKAQTLSKLYQSNEEMKNAIVKNLKKNTAVNKQNLKSNY